MARLPASGGGAAALLPCSERAWRGRSPPFPQTPALGVERSGLTPLRRPGEPREVIARLGHPAGHGRGPARGPCVCSGPGRGGLGRGGAAGKWCRINIGCAAPRAGAPRGSCLQPGWERAGDRPKKRAPDPCRALPPSKRAALCRAGGSVLEFPPNFGFARGAWCRPQALRLPRSSHPFGKGLLGPGRDQGMLGITQGWQMALQGCREAGGLPALSPAGRHPRNGAGHGWGTGDQGQDPLQSGEPSAALAPWLCRSPRATAPRARSPAPAGRGVRGRGLVQARGKTGVSQAG